MTKKETKVTKQRVYVPFIQRKVVNQEKTVVESKVEREFKYIDKSLFKHICK